MTTFRQISGQLVKSYTTNPDNPLEGQMWYNQTELKLKGLTALEAWSAGSNMISIRGYGAGCGIQTSGLSFGGIEPPGATDTDKTEEYNGSGWSTGGNMVTARRLLGGATAAPQTAALGFGGLTYAGGVQSLTEEYDGSSWTAGGALSTARRTVGGAGIQTAALAFGGYTTVDVTSTEEYDGSAWTAGGSLNTARRMGAGTGLQTAALAFGGDTGSVSTATEKYDGSTWTTSGALNTARRNFGGAGTQTAGLGFGGYTATAVTGATESFDGSTWTTSPASLATARVASTGFGTGTSALSAGGYTTVYLGNTEEYNKSATVITAGAWASGPSVNNSRLSINNGLGPTSASLIFAGNPGTAPYASTGTEEYDGSSWTIGGNTPAQASHYSGAAGTQTAALGFANSDGGSLFINYDGSTWSVNPSSFPGTSNGSGTGESNSAIYAGYSGTNSLEWDGASWTAGGTMNTSRTSHGTGFGNASSAIFATGSTGPSSVVTADSEEYDGTTWTSVGDVITARRRLAASRPLSSASGYIFGGVTPTNNFSPAYTNTESWNGTNWSTSPNLAVGTGNQFGAGTTDAFNISGHSTAVTAATEIFNPETTALNLKTLTTS